ncbi:MAG: HD domain-containing protein [Chloroflexota bacterium]|nr:MAG: HD domain-containing protein [Chloroflexota bacterium]
MKSVYVTDLIDGADLFNEPFLLADVVRRETKDGRPYLLSTFRDRTGQINGVFWDVPPDVEQSVKAGMVTLVTGRVRSYKNALQITATDLNPFADPDMSEFLPSSGRPVDEMMAELRLYIDELEQPWRDLTAAILLEEEFLPLFANAPAARSMHHAYVGGLLEHTLSMAQIARFLADHYPYVNKSLLVAGTLLHDLGKALEYETASSFQFSDDGRLVGHVVRATILIERAADNLANVSEEERRQVVHLVASHHGTHEWGAPVVPKTLEAILLHQVDLLDSRVQGFFDHLRSDDGRDTWTTRSSYMFNTELRRPADFE